MKFYDQDLQIQSKYSDGRSTIDELVLGSIKNGRTIIGFTDHADGWLDGGVKLPYFSTKDKFQQYLADINHAKQTYAGQGITVLAGLEVEIDAHGQLALANGIRDTIGSDENLANYVDFVIGVIHSECFTETMAEAGVTASDPTSSTLLMQNITGLISNPYITIWGHPSQVVHGQYRRDYTVAERALIIDCLQQRPEPLLMEYNLNPYPRYEDWGSKTSAYVTDELAPNDLPLFQAYYNAGGTFVVSTDAHDIEQTGRLNATTVVPTFIRDRITYLGT